MGKPCLCIAVPSRALILGFVQLIVNIKAFFGGGISFLPCVFVPIKLVVTSC